MDGLALQVTDRAPRTVVAGLGGGLSSSSLGEPLGNSKESGPGIFFWLLKVFSF